VKSYVNVNVFTKLSENPETAFNRAAINDPHFSFRELLEEMWFSGSDARQARHLGDATPVEFHGQIVRQLARVGTSGTSKQQGESLRHLIHLYRAVLLRHPLSIQRRNS
jgi:hypothetical protein